MILNISSNPTIIWFYGLEDPFQSNYSTVLWSLKSFCEQRWTKGKTWAHFTEASPWVHMGLAGLKVAQGCERSGFGIIVIDIK